MPQKPRKRNVLVRSHHISYAICSCTFLDKLVKLWKAAAYAFFALLPEIEYDSRGHVYHAFRCLNCTHKVSWYPDTADAGLTGALRCHIRKCWGEDVLSAADNTNDLTKSHEVVDKELSKKKPKNGSIVAMLKRFRSKIVSYSTCPHTKTEVHLRPFKIFADRGFKSLMKTGQLKHYIPHPTTVSCDTKTVFAKMHRHISNYLRKLDGLLSFATDAWTLPNHRAYIALTVHFVCEDGTPIKMILDFIEVPKV
ncbi:hypothetical protein EV421DRAFT_1717197, partial [Armillaria borealis]